jgi:hypothetical protein
VGNGGDQILQDVSRQREFGEDEQIRLLDFGLFDETQVLFEIRFDIPQFSPDLREGKIKFHRQNLTTNTAPFGQPSLILHPISDGHSNNCHLSTTNGVTCDGIDYATVTNARSGFPEQYARSIGAYSAWAPASESDNSGS